MSSTDENKPAKSGRRSKKGNARRQKADLPDVPAPVQMQIAEQEQQQVPQAPAASEPFEAAVAKAKVMVAETDAVPADAPAPTDGPSPADTPTAESAPVSFQTIANAYRDYTRKSFAEFGSFFEQLSGVRSLDKAVEVQTEFVKRAYESSVAESHKIRELHRKLARQTMEPFEGIVGKTPETHGKP